MTCARSSRADRPASVAGDGKAPSPPSDVVTVIGANRMVNPAAQEDPIAPIAGMPVPEVWKAQRVFVSKRGQGTGYSGIETPLFYKFYKESTRRFYDGAKASFGPPLQKIG